MPICVLAAVRIVCERRKSWRREVRRGGWNFVMIFTLLIVSSSSGNARDGPTQQMDYFWLCLGALETSQPQK
jgi:hypothetical protein